VKLFRTWFGLRTSIAIVGLCSLLFWGLRVSRESRPDRLYSGWLREGDESRRLQAAQELGGLDAEVGDAASALARSMRTDLSAAVRKRSAVSLAAVVVKSKDTSTTAAATVALVAALKDADPAVRAAAADGLGRIGPEPDAVIPALLRASAEEHEWVRGAAIAALGLVQLSAGVDREEVRGPIVAAIREESLHVREKGIYAFWASAEKSPGFTRAMLRDSDVRNRRAALTALAREGRLASAVAPELSEALSDQDSAVREGAARALRNAGLPTTSSISAGSPVP
jgi:HEAT repeat protein